jgi:hypothetical protein
MAKFIIVHSVKVATDFVPQTFGRLTTIGPKFRLPIGNQNKKASYQVCRCDCGSVGVFDCWCLKRATTRSCGCLNLEVAKNKFTKHGMHKSAEYKCWKGMVQRCVNPKASHYMDYGGRGIRVCDRWREPNGRGFMNFFEDMQKRPPNTEIDREDNDGHYTPDNCRWATRQEQSRNKRSTVHITYKGKTQCMADWADELGIRRLTLWARIKKGWPIEEALTTPIRKQRPRRLRD